MATAAGVVQTYDDGNRLEDVLRVVVQLSPTDTPFTSGIAKSRAYNTIHQWPEDSLAASADQSVVEGSAHAFAAVTPPARVVNLTQVFAKTFAISSTERWTKGAGVDDQYIYQQQKALMEIARDIEHAFVRGSLASGNDTVARKMAGALNFITTNGASVADGTKLTESLFNDMANSCYDEGGRPDEVYVGARLKRIISSFTAGATKNISSDDKRLVNAVDVYDSDFGMMKVLLSREQFTTTTTKGNSIMMIQNSKFKMAVGEPIRVLPESEVAQDSHGTKGVVRGELTLEALGEKHNAARTNVSSVFN